MQIGFVISHDFREKIEKHPKWQLDLGKAYSERTPEGLKVDIKDPFIIKFFQEYNSFCYKVGRLGPIDFYTSYVLPNDQFWIYVDDKKYELPYNSLELQLDPEKYLGKTLMTIQNQNIDPNEN